MTRSRRHFTAEEKAEVVRRHLADKVPVSNLADEFQVQPTLVHLLGQARLGPCRRSRVRSHPRRSRQSSPRRSQGPCRITQLEAKLAKKNEVVAELMEAHVQLKKELGEL